MTADEYRSLALTLPEATEDAHMGHPDFRVRKKIFATLGPEEEWGMVSLTPEQQAMFVEVDPEVFSAFPNKWGLRGATRVQLDAAKQPAVLEALTFGWRNKAPKKLVNEFDNE